jgi:hypothetical protein
MSPEIVDSRPAEERGGWSDSEWKKHAADLLEQFGYDVHLVDREGDIPPINRAFGDVLQVFNTIYIRVSDSPAEAVGWKEGLWHEVGHAISDAIFYRGICRLSGVNWCIGYNPDIGEPGFSGHLFREDGLPLRVGQFEHLASHTAMHAMLVAGAGRGEMRTASMTTLDGLVYSGSELPQEPGEEYAELDRDLLRAIRTYPDLRLPLGGHESLLARWEVARWEADHRGLLTQLRRKHLLHSPWSEGYPTTDDPQELAGINEFIHCPYASLR